MKFSTRTGISASVTPFIMVWWHPEYAVHPGKLKIVVFVLAWSALMLTLNRFWWKEP